MNKISRFRHDLSMLRVELKKVEDQVVVNDRYIEMCQCATEIVLAKTNRPKRIKAIMLVHVLMDTISRKVMDAEMYSDFEKTYRIPKIKSHIGSGYIDADWLITESHGYELTISNNYVKIAMINALFEIESYFDSRKSNGFKEWVSTFKSEINKFEPIKNFLNDGFNEFLLKSALEKALAYMQSLNN